MSGDRLRVVTPVCLMTSGSFGIARLTRFCTRICARFRSTPCSKVIVKLYAPSLVHDDDMYSISSTPLTCSSIGLATDSETTCALAPAKVQLTDTFGGETGG